MKIKVLPLDFWMDFELVSPDEDDWPPEAIECQAVFNRPGWYYDRLTKKSWFERPDGRSFSYKPERFLHQLGLLEAGELDCRTVDALRKICDVGLATKHQKKILSNWYIWRMGRNIYFSAVKERLKLIS